MFAFDNIFDSNKYIPIRLITRVSYKWFPSVAGLPNLYCSDRWIVYTKSRKQLLHRKDLLYDTGSITRKQMLCLDLRIKNPNPNPNLFITFRNLVYFLLSLWAHVRGEWATKETWRNVVDISSLLNYLKYISLAGNTCFLPNIFWIFFLFSCKRSKSVFRRWLWAVGEGRLLNF